MLMKKTKQQKIYQKALAFHKQEPKGKIQVSPSKPVDTDDELSLAYSPGVAEPCREIAKQPDKAYDYTIKGNLVAVISNGSAVLGLGNIGPLAAKPVMEGKGILFKQFAGINVFDIELNTKNVEEFITACKALSPTFGGINLEDISAPDCFEIEKQLEEELNIPVFHDDQHGTAIITAAALLNACHIVQKKVASIRVVFNGAGSAGIACARLLIELGVRKKNIIMCDSKGVIHKDRKDKLNIYKKEFAISHGPKTLKEALKGADVFIGLSVKDTVTSNMLKTMNPKPIVFAMANPDPEIKPEVAKKAVPDLIMATGRSDYPNQVNNVLGFPSIFRGALDTHATHINLAMKKAAVFALSELAREDVPDSVSRAYHDEVFHFGPNYILPKPFDMRVLTRVAPAVAKAAMESGVARKPITDFEKYKLKLAGFQSRRRGFIRAIINKVKRKNKACSYDLPRIVFPEGNSKRTLKAINMLYEEKLMKPILLGDKEEVLKLIEDMELDNMDKVEIIDPASHAQLKNYTKLFYEMKQRKGILKKEAGQLMKDPNYFGAMMLKQDQAEALITGATQNYADSVRPILQIIGTGKRKIASGVNIVLVKDKILFFADTTVNINPTAEDIAHIAVHTARVARGLNVQPHIAFLSFSNFTGRRESPRKMREATLLVKKWYPDWIVEGEMQADTALNPNIVKNIFPFCQIKEGANVLIFPNLDSSNIAYKLVQQLGEGEVLGPFLMGVKQPANVVQRTGVTEDILNTIIMTCLKVQAYREFTIK